MSDQLPHRRTSLRLRNYDYAQAGAYFITICTAERALLFGSVRDGAPALTAMGHVAQNCWLDLPTHHPGLELDEYVLMPNHLHGILVIDEENGKRGEGEAGLAPTPVEQSTRQGSLAAMIGSFKSATTREIRKYAGEPKLELWQRGYYEHVIRSKAALARIRQYIAENPAKWADDHDNPMNWRT